MTGPAPEPPMLPALAMNAAPEALPAAEPPASAVPVPAPAAPATPAMAPATRNPAMDLYGPPKVSSTAKTDKIKFDMGAFTHIKLVEAVSLTAIVVLTVAIAWAAWTKFRPMPPARVISASQAA